MLYMSSLGGWGKVIWYMILTSESLQEVSEVFVGGWFLWWGLMVCVGVCFVLPSPSWPTPLSIYKITLSGLTLLVNLIWRSIPSLQALFKWRCDELWHSPIWKAMKSATIILWYPTFRAIVSLVLLQSDLGLLQLPGQRDSIYFIIILVHLRFQ